MSSAQETVVLSGHIIASLILAKVLDTILMMGGTFDIEEISIGKKREDPSRARIVVRASSPNLLTDILRAIQAHGASIEHEAACGLASSLFLQPRFDQGATRSPKAACSTSFHSIKMKQRIKAAMHGHRLVAFVHKLIRRLPNPL